MSGMLYGLERDRRLSRLNIRSGSQFSFRIGRSHRSIHTLILGRVKRQFGKAWAGDPNVTGHIAYQLVGVRYSQHCIGRVSSAVGSTINVGLRGSPNGIS